ncbi:MAG: hydroxylamine reductase, partial [Elusimicrobia bacterium]|nr:hydroxylamine reductase [Elusimicrobiota bacterium]
QCEQTLNCTGCTAHGVCGKDPETAVMIDVLIYVLMGVGYWGRLARAEGVKTPEADSLIMRGLFTTITNVNFDPHEIMLVVQEGYKTEQDLRAAFLAAYKKRTGSDFAGPALPHRDWDPGDAYAVVLERGKAARIVNPDLPEDVQSLRELLLYGMKGMAAYAEHASVLGHEDDTVKEFFYKGLSALAEDQRDTGKLLDLVMELGHVNFKCMEVLDAANTGAYGHPVPTKVSLGARKGPAILVSGHDLLDLEQLLKQTEGKGINIYTHGEMLPAHGYPGLKKYKHFAGHYGTAWQNQYKEFSAFPGAILMTTNCIQRPANVYKDNIFTTGVVRWPGLPNIPAKGGKKDFSPVIKRALELGGYKEDVPGKEILVGFAHNAILSAAGKVVELVKAGKIKHFYLIGGCDGAKPGRNYYTEFAARVPKDCVVLTLACGKFRFNTQEFGDIDGIPRLLDCGQCNDAYSAIVVAGALAKAFNCGINDLPLTLIISWYEQKAVCVLLTLLALGVKNIRLGPSLPAFVSPGVMSILSQKFGLWPIGGVEEDMKMNRR